MKWLPIAVSLLFLSLASPLAAKAPTEKNPKPSVNISVGELTATPEMWFYEQYMRQQQDPRTAVREKAEFRSVERQRRLAAMRWYGFSNSRPKVGSDPMYGPSAPTWVSGDSFHPTLFGVGNSATVVVPPSSSSANR